MRHFVDREGDDFFVRDERELIAQMHAVAFIKSANDWEYMLGLAHRAQLFTGHHYRTDTYENCIADMLATGFLVEKT